MQNRGCEGDATPKERSGASGATRLRDRIDRGAGGDKVAFKDPAAAPLGTDDEAAGTPPSRAQVAQAMQQEATRASKAGRKPGPADMQAAGSRRRVLLIVTVFLALAAVSVAVLAP
ncbi:hypothetical protein HGE68_06500 [Rhodobacteraceae bacterium R_SAG6]|nr:hypothetical protein [Rhodobacteraceae bacterium R_SAG6]